MRLQRMVTGRQWRRVPSVTAGALLLAGLVSGAGTGSTAPAAGSHAGTPVRRAESTTAMKYHGVIGASPTAVETAAQAPAPPPFDLPGYQACVNNPQDFANTQFLQASAYLAGWSNASKLGGSAALGTPEPALASGSGSDKLGLDPSATGFINATTFPVASNGRAYGCGITQLQLDYRGRREFPPLRATFLGFGFVPVTATVHLTQVGPAPVKTLAFDPEKPPAGQPQARDVKPATVVSTSDVSLRLSDVKVNGVSLDVGSNCHTTGPLTSPNPINSNELVLTGGDQPGDPLPWFGVNGKGVLAGGALAGEATIPPFTGCVTPAGDNVNPLLDSSVSGPGNYVRVVAGPVCFQHINSCSPPDVPQYQPLWTVTHGTGPGGRTASGPVILQSGVVLDGARTVTAPDGQQLTAYGYFIGCGLEGRTGPTTGSTIRVTIPDASGPLRSGALGSIRWTSFGDCRGYGYVCHNGSPTCKPNSGLRTDPVQVDDSHWTITQEGTAHLDGLQYEPGNNPPATGTISHLNTDDVVLDVTGTNVPVTPGSSTGIRCTAQLTMSIGTVFGSTQYSNSDSALTIGEAPFNGVAGRFNTGAGGLHETKSTCPASALVGLDLVDGIPGTEGDSAEDGAHSITNPGFFATYHLGGTIITSP